MNLRPIGSSGIQTSTVNMQIVPSAPTDWTLDRYNLYSFDFYNDQDCHVYVNGSSDAIFLRAGQGFSAGMDNYHMTLIDSFIIQESGITFNWIGYY